MFGYLECQNMSFDYWTLLVRAELDIFDQFSQITNFAQFS